jgi:predicted 3-demethylubiquinone-9 3-methyltransferase (glyoxalase superfamily)
VRDGIIGISLKINFMQKITPHLWFDKEAKEAAELYTSLFPNSKITNVSTIHDTPSGDCDIVSFELSGQPFMAISAGPLFKFNPSVSFHVKCATFEEVDMLWEKLSQGGMVLMELGEYPFSKRYGWLADKYGVSWQIVHTPEQDIKQKIIPVVMFVGEMVGRGEEAVNFYTSIFSEANSKLSSKVKMALHYGKGEEPDKEGSLKYASFELLGQEFGLMDSAHEHKFAFNEATSFIIPCDTQEEIDYFWEKLSADPKAEQCGWLKDKFGFSWQVSPVAMDEMMKNGTPEQIDRVTKAFLLMKKFDIAKLQEAYEGK